MSRAYALVAHDAVIEVFSSGTKSQRLELLRIFQQLADDPHQEGDYTQASTESRQVYVKRFGRWHVSFWADHAVAELRIVALRNLPL